MRKLAALVLLISTTIFSCEAKDVNRLWNINNLAYVKMHSSNYASFIDGCVRKGKQYAEMEPLSVIAKNKTFAPDMHYYCSMSPYYWPVEENNRVKYVCRDGQGNPEAADYNQWSLSDLATRLQAMSLAYYFTNDSKIYKAFVKQIDVWFSDTETRMYPNFDYSQVIPGNKDSKGTSAGIIEARPLTPIIESICLMNSCRSIGYFRNKRIKKWFSAFLEWMQTSELCKWNYNAENNIGTSYNVTLLRIAIFVNSKELAISLCESFPDRVESQIAPDGKQPLELVRTNAYSYSVHNLWFIVEFCKIAKSAGWTSVYEGCRPRIRAATNYLSRFEGNEGVFPYKQINCFEAPKKALMTIKSCIRGLDGEKVVIETINNIYDIIQFNVYI